MKKEKKKKKVIAIIILVLLSIIVIALFFNRSDNSPVPAELIDLRQTIEQNNQDKDFDLQYEYVGPNSHQPLPFNYE